MKKIILGFGLVILLFSTFLAAEQDLVLTISGTYYNPADSDFKSMFGKSKYFPEGKIALRIKGNFYLWGSAGYLSTTYDWEEWSNKGVKEADIDGERVLNKLIISGGLGYYFGFMRKNDFSVKLELGVCSITDTIEATRSDITTGTVVSVEESKEKGIGFRGNLAVTYGLHKNIFAEAAVGYMYASDKIEDERINLGGLRLSLGLGIAL